MLLVNILHTVYLVMILFTNYILFQLLLPWDSPCKQKGLLLRQSTVIEKDS